MKLPESVTLKAGRAQLLNKKHAPTTLFGAGIVGMIATTVLAARQTLKAKEVIETAKDDLEAVKLAVDIAAKKGDESTYTEKDRQKDVTYVYVRTTLDIIKLYAPVVALGAFSVAALTKSHFILNQRNAGLAAAYAVLDKSFTEYRSRVQKELGQDADDHYRYGGEIVDEKEEKDGKVVHIKKFRGTDEELRQLTDWHATLKDEEMAKKLKAGAKPEEKAAEKPAEKTETMSDK